MQGTEQLRVDGIDIAYEIEGAGPPLLLVHGLESSRRAWDDVVPLLAPHHRVVRPDLRGHGDSGGPLDPTGYAAETVGADLLRLTESLGLEDVLVVAHSFGGTCALLAALERPDAFRGIVLVNSWTFGMPEQGRSRTLQYLDAISKRGILGIYDMTPALRRNHPTEGSRYDDPVFSAARRSERAKVRSEAYVAIAEQNLDRPSFHEELHNLTIPTLLVVGDGDSVMRPAMDFLHALVKQSEFVVLPRSGHNPMFDAPEALAECVLEFARTLG